MLYSNTCQYAIRALVHLACHVKSPCMTKEIAQQAEIPYYFLAKILSNLTQAGLLRSLKGRTGGFRLAKSAERITLYKIKEAVDGTKDLVECAVGIGRCDESTPCPIHETFKPIRESIKNYLKKTTLADITYAQERKTQNEALKKARGKRGRS